MIRLKRPTEPPLFKTKAMLAFRKQLRDFYTKNTQANKQKRPVSMSDELVAKVIHALGLTHDEKCAYCERKLEEQKMTFDHFRPVQSAKGFKGDYSEKHYWWLAGRWQNLLVACPDCNSAKSSWFPVKGRRARMQASLTELKRENTLLVDPFNEDPHLHLSYEPDGKMVAVTEKGAATLEVLQLNRRSLVEERKASVKEMDALIRELKRSTENHKLFEEKLTNAIGRLARAYSEKNYSSAFLAFRRYY